MLHSAHYQYATTRLKALRNRDDTQSELERDILRHLLANELDLSGRSAPVVIKPKSAKPQTVKAKSIALPTPSRDAFSLHVLIDPATGLVHLASSLFPFDYYAAKLLVPHDPIRSFTLAMCDEPSARGLAKAFHDFMAPMRTPHPTSSRYWYDARALGLIASVIHYGGDTMGAKAWGSRVPPDHGLRTVLPLLPETPWLEHYDAIIADYALVMGISDDRELCVPATAPVAVLSAHQIQPG